MSIRTRNVIVGLAVVLAAILLLHGIARRTQRQASNPEWLDPHQPPVSVDFGLLTPDQSWAANRCRPMSACCTGYTAGTRIRRDYPATLADCAPGISASVNLNLGS